MTFSEYKVKLQQKIETLIADRQKFALIAGEELTALIVNRLINKGVDASGDSFPKYSDKPLALYKFAAQKTNRANAFKTFKDKVYKGLIPSYANWRIHNGLPVDKRTHSFTGDMLKSLRAEVIEDTPQRTVVEIKSRKEDLQKRLNQNSKRMGVSLLQPSDDEVKVITELNKERIKKIITA